MISTRMNARRVKRSYWQRRGRASVDRPKLD